MSQIGISGPVLFDGLVLVRDAAELAIREIVPTVIREMSTGARRQFVLPAAAGDPLIRPRLQVELTWSSASSQAGVIRAALAVPRVHTLVLWKPIALAWLSDGSRTVFNLPWDLAASLETKPAGAYWTPVFGTSAALIVDPDLSAVQVDAAEFAADVPPAGTVWINGRRVKLEPIPAGQYLYGSLVGIHNVFADQSVDDRRYTGPNLEPQKLRLVEA